MTWNYRILQHPEGFFNLITVYYEDETGKIVAFSENPTPAGDTVESISYDIAKMAGAIKHPILTHDDLGQ